ncbi:hypothetical protein ACRALDRAFT_2033983 [Sodiomyces alcalophilus JCM 7366]|uniref:uncharacterized protein n=1 Tax=Sodiomyces alcalophilus JCM 7366 TaxID=591952 RepID=UPI0039B49DA2
MAGPMVRLHRQQRVVARLPTAREPMQIRCPNAMLRCFVWTADMRRSWRHIELRIRIRRMQRTSLPL